MLKIQLLNYEQTLAASADMGLCSGLDVKNPITNRFYQPVPKSSFVADRLLKNQVTNFLTLATPPTPPTITPPVVVCQVAWQTHSTPGGRSGTASAPPPAWHSTPGCGAMTAWPGTRSCNRVSHNNKPTPTPLLYCHFPLPFVCTTAKESTISLDSKLCKL